MKKVILEPHDRLRVIVGNVLYLDIEVEKAFRFLAKRKNVDNSNTEYSIKTNYNL